MFDPYLNGTDCLVTEGLRSEFPLATMGETCILDITSVGKITERRAITSFQVSYRAIPANGAASAPVRPCLP
jgi:hypothetical protein